MFTVKLTVGQHVEDDHHGKSVTYVAGDVFKTKTDLAKRWPEKFERAEGAHAHAPAIAPTAALGDMTLEQLRAVAAEEGVIWSAASTREELIELIEEVEA